MGFNKGEWSELYTFLHLFENPDLVIVNENLEAISNNVFRILEIILSEKKYLIGAHNITKVMNGGDTNQYPMSYISKQNQMLLNKILAHKSAKGSFEINEITPLVDNLFDGQKPKGASNVKGDLEANILESHFNKIINLKYNIKSSLGAPATLLNASNHTNFIYEITNIDDDIMKKTNTINTKNKLLDRCAFLNQKNAIVNFKKVESDTFDYNLKLVDSNLGIFLADILYLSYSKNEKDIKKLIVLISKNKDEYTFYEKKVGDFANAVTFGMRASEKWNGINEVNGGIILVTKLGKVYLLDLIYYKNIVDKYLIDNIKLESPSSSRYGMFDIYKENERYFFKLNLQIRFK
jgi:DNA (cytosine-5)-methyltransferase 1